jgi:hypothetical protein
VQEISESIIIKQSKIAIYLFSTLILLVLSVFITGYTWDLSLYSNLMYIKNMELYLIIYGFFVLVMIGMSLYVVIKELTGSNKISIRQKSAK